MKMKYMLLLLVVCQFKRESEMRPTNLSDGFKLTQSLTTEMNITLNGTMRINANPLFLSLSDKESNTICSITYDASNEKATMESELSDPDPLEYKIDHDPNVPAKFWLYIEPRIMKQQQLIHLHFEAGGAGPLTFEACKIKNFENIHRIDVQGADSVSSLLFQFTA